MKIRILVLGSTGFAGTHIALALEKIDCDLVLACRNRNKLHPLLSDNTIREGSMYDSAYLESLFTDIDVVINAFAWTSLYSHYQLSKELFLNPTLTLIDTSKKAGVARFINLSSLSAIKHEKASKHWPHLQNVITIENYLQKMATETFEVINLRCGLFTGKYYALGLLPILLPRLKTHLVPLIQGGDTFMPLLDGEDLAQAFVKAALIEEFPNIYENINILGPTIPRAKEVLQWIHNEFHYPYPHFSVPFWIAYRFGSLMELIDSFMPSEP
jgi:nucleoside-diphosphate-sugar epimerase